MHIPDGYLSPRTCGVFFALMLPIWFVALKKAEKALKVKRLPVLALSASFVFVISLFNVPIPGGSTGHMIGSVLVAIVLGPWVAVVAISLVLALQALLFGDGGITALGANAFNLAFFMSFSGYLFYRILVGREPTNDPQGSRRMWIATFIAAYLAVNLTALLVALELGVQPTVAAGPDGNPLYAPYPMGVAVAAMMAPHLLVLGPIEALGTALGVGYLFRSGRLGVSGKGLESPGALWAGLALLIALTPLGLIAPGTPWAERSGEEIRRLVGYLPAGMEKVQGLWRGVLPGYSLGSLHPAAAYVISALVGTLAVVGLFYLWTRRWDRR